MYFVINRANNGQFYFVGKGDNHETIFTSEMYQQKSSAISTINTIKREAASAQTTDRS